MVNLSAATSEKIIDQIFDHVTTHVRSNSLRVIHGLVLSCSNANPAYTLKKFVPVCTQRISSELSHGAASRRTTNSTVPIASDVALQWHLVLLIGAVSGASTEVCSTQKTCSDITQLTPYVSFLQLVDYQDDLFSIIKQLTESTFTEITYASTGKLIEKIIFNMTTVFPYEARLVNPDVWQSEGGST